MLYSLVIIGLVLCFSAFVVVFTVKVLLSVILWKSDENKPFKPVKLTKRQTKAEKEEHRKNQLRKERMAIIDANIENYDGTAYGQVDVPEEV